MTLCTTCRKANVSCPIYPQDTMKCVEYAPTESDKPKIYHFDPSEERGYYICSEGYKCTVGQFVALTEYRELEECYLNLVDDFQKTGAENAALESEVAEKDKRIAELEFITKEQLSRLTALTEGITEATGKEGSTAILTHIARLEADAERLSCLMNESGRFYEQGLSYQMTGRLREYIDSAMRAEQENEG